MHLSHLTALMKATLIGKERFWLTVPEDIAHHPQEGALDIAGYISP